MGVKEIFQRFDFDKNYGFVIQNPLKNLDSYFEPWIKLVENIEPLREEPSSFLSEISTLPELDVTGLDCIPSLRVAHTLLSIISHSYVHLNPSEPQPVLPRCLAVPWTAVSDKLGVPPVVIHSTMSLSNWQLINSEGQFCLDNLTTIFSFDCSRDLEVRSNI